VEEDEVLLCSYAEGNVQHSRTPADPLAWGRAERGEAFLVCQFREEKRENMGACSPLKRQKRFGLLGNCQTSIRFWKNRWNFVTEISLVVVIQIK